MEKTVIQEERWDIVSLILHIGFGLTVAFQLISSLIMHRPYQGRVIPAYTANAFILHSYIGLLATAFVIAYWIWVLGFRREKLQHLFPWTLSGWKKTGRDLYCFCRFRFPESNIGGLAGLIHGLGLILVTIVGIIGTTLFFTLPDTKAVSPFVHTVKEAHEFLAYWVWWYFIGHALMAVLHWFHTRFSSA